MRPWLAFLALWASIFTTSFGCGAFDTFEVTIEDSATIPGNYQGSIIQPAYGGNFSSLNLSAESSFSNHDVKPDDVDAIFVKSVRITDSEPNLLNLQKRIQSITLFIRAPGLARTQIATGSNFPASASAELQVDSSFNIKPYATATAMTIEADIQLKDRPLFTFKILTTVTLLVDIDLLGA